MKDSPLYIILFLMLFVMIGCINQSDNFIDTSFNEYNQQSEEQLKKLEFEFQESYVKYVQRNKKNKSQADSLYTKLNTVLKYINDLEENAKSLANANSIDSDERLITDSATFKMFYYIDGVFNLSNSLSRDKGCRYFLKELKSELLSNADTNLRIKLHFSGNDTKGMHITLTELKIEIYRVGICGFSTLSQLGVE